MQSPRAAAGEESCVVRAAVSACWAEDAVHAEVLVAVFFPQNDSKFLGADVLSAMSQGDLRVADTTEADDTVMTVQVRGRIGFNLLNGLDSENMLGCVESGLLSLCDLSLEK